VKFIGLMMIAHENDILGAVLHEHDKIADAIYVLDGTVPSTHSWQMCHANGKCVYYAHDRQLPRPPYPERPVDGYRQFLLERAYRDHGRDNWFLLLHGDEVWTFDPRDVVAEHPGADGFIFPLPCYFPREGEKWDYDVHPLEQLRWNLGPGWPELRMFRGGEHVGFDPESHFNTTPHGISSIVRDGRQIKHYPYRSPAVQRERAERHRRTGFDPDNYQHVEQEIFSSVPFIAQWQQQQVWQVLTHD